MTTTASTIQRPTNLLAAAVVVAAVMTGSVAFAVSRQDNAPAPQAPQIATQPTSQTHHFHATTSGGRVMLGE
jgi:hypothetical protein